MSFKSHLSTIGIVSAAGEARRMALLFVQAPGAIRTVHAQRCGREEQIDRKRSDWSKE